MADRNDPSRRVWECPECSGVNVWNWQDAERVASMLKLENPRFTTANNLNPKEVHIAHGSAFDNVCGCCGTNFVRNDSPILAECYVHEGTGLGDDDPNNPDNWDWDE